MANVQRRPNGQRQKVADLRRGEIYFTAGHSAVSTVPYPVEVIIDTTAANGLDVRSSIRLDQIRTVDRQRLARRLGAADSSTVAQVDEALRISLGLVHL